MFCICTYTVVIHSAPLIDSLWYGCNVFLDDSSRIPLIPLMQQSSSAAPRDIPPELEDELFSRNRYFFGDGFEGIRNALVIVVGLGGVGSHAAHMLVSRGGRFPLHITLCKYLCFEVCVIFCMKPLLENTG